MPDVKSLSDHPSSRIIALEWPLVVAEVEYRDVVVRRPTTADRAKLDLAAGPEAPQNVRVVLATAAGMPVTPEAWDAMDVQDTEALALAAQEFLKPCFPKPKPKPAFAPGAVVAETVTLAFPVSYDGKTYDAVEVRRLTIGRLAAFVENRGSVPDTGTVFRYPVYFDAAGAPVPDIVLDALEMTDHAKVVEVTARFLPPDLTGAAA